MQQRMFIIDEYGRQHQSWSFVREEVCLILTLDIRQNHDIPTLWGLYLQEDYSNKISNNPFIQDNLPSSHKDYNLLYHQKVAN